MPICTILEYPRLTPEQAEQVHAHVRSTGPVPPEGARLVVGGFGDDGWRAITIWESEDARDRFFSERLGPAYEQARLSLDETKRKQFDVQMLVAGDLTGAPA